MYFSSDAIYGDSSECPINTFGVLFEPFNNCYSNHKTINRSPIICINCGGYLCKYASVDNVLGQWVCPLCKHSNPSFYNNLNSRENIREIFYELNENYVNYEGDYNGMMSFAVASTINNPLYIIILDEVSAKEEDSFTLLLLSLQQMVKTNCNSKVAIIVCSKSALHLPILGEFEKEELPYALSYDIIPGYKCKGNLYTQLISQNKHMAKASTIINHIEMLQHNITKLTNNNSKTENYTLIDSIIELATIFSQQQRLCVHIIWFCSKTLPISIDRLTEVNSNLALAYAKLGTKAISNGVFIDILHSSLRDNKFDCLDALAGSTGGIVVTSESFVHDEIINTLQLIINSNNRDRKCSSNIIYPRKGTLAILEVRTCPLLILEKFIGPIHQYNDYLNNFKSIGYDLVNRRFVKDTVDSILACDTNNSFLSKYSSANRVDIEDVIYNDITEFADSNRAISTGALSRCDSKQSTLSLQFNPNQQYLEANKAVDAAYIQFVIRYDVDSVSGSTISNTRVHTIEVPIVRDFNNFLVYYNSINPYVYTVMLAKCLVADYHDACISHYGGARITIGKTDDNDDEIQNNPKYKTQRIIDGYINKLCDIFLLHNIKTVQDDSSKLNIITRALYQLREGLLLDGGQVYPQVAYLLRSHFLTSSYDYASRLLLPQVKIFPLSSISKLNSSSSNDDYYNQLIVAPSDILALLPDTIAIVDCGDSIIIRYGGSSNKGMAPVSNIDEILGLFIYLMKDKMSSKNRFPCPVFHLLANPTGNRDRLVLPRLNPGHKDNMVCKLMTFPYLLKYNITTNNNLHEWVPYSDQESYYIYLSKTCGPYYNNITTAYARNNNNRAPSINTIRHDNENRR